MADRTALEQRPASDGSVFVIAAKGGKVALPGVTLRARCGLGPQPDDFSLRDNLYCMSTARALLANMRPSRARSGTARTLKRGEIEVWLDQFLRNSGKERLNALRDQIKAIAPSLKMDEAAAELDEMIGTLLGTSSGRLASPVAKARARGSSFDPQRIALFEKLHDALRRFPPEPPREWHPTRRAAINQAFFEAYFSNFIEGTEFALDEASAIVFEGVIPPNRPADAHDVLGTFRLVSRTEEMTRLPKTAETLSWTSCGAGTAQSWQVAPRRRRENSSSCPTSSATSHSLRPRMSMAHSSKASASISGSPSRCIAQSS